MGGFAPPNVPCVKGPIPYCLDEVSKRADASARLKELGEAIRSLAPDYKGLETVLDTHLMSHVFKDGKTREDVVAHLKKCWFDEGSSDAFFAGGGIAAAYAEGVLKAIELSLKSEPPVPINAWWLLDQSSFKVLTLAEADENAETVGGQVTLLIQTPRPAGETRKGKTILGSACAWVSEPQAQAGGATESTGGAGTWEVPKTAE